MMLRPLRKLLLMFGVVVPLLALQGQATDTEPPTIYTTTGEPLHSTSERSTEITGEPSRSSDTPSTSTSWTTSPRPAYTPDVTSDVCGTSLVTSGEEVLKCQCTAFEVNCRYLDIAELPRLLSFPKNIHSANFAGNHISNINADTFYNGKEVHELDLSHNAIDFVSVSAFKGFGNLESLDLSHNRIWNLPNAAFEGLDQLRRLDLGSNDLVAVFPKLLAPLANLRQLNLASNPLQELQPKHFEHLQHLEALNLQATLLKAIPDHLFVFTPKLKSLDLSSNLLEEVPSEALYLLDRAKSLDLSNNPIRTIKAEAFQGMRGLVMLYMDRMPELREVEAFAFGDAQQLQELHLSYNFHLTHIHEHAFVCKRNNRKVALRQLFVRQDDLSAIPRGLLEWDAGVELHMRDNPLHCDCAAQWMLTARLKNDFQAHARCSGPAGFENLYLSSMKGHALSCGLQLSEMVLIGCAVVTALLIVVLIVAFLAWRRSYRGYSKPRYIPNEKQLDDVDYSCGDDGF